MKNIILEEKIILSPKRKTDLDILKQSKQAFFSISLTNNQPDIFLIEASLEWLRQHVPKTGFLIGDSLFAKTLVIQKGLSFIEAAHEATILTKKLQDKIEVIHNGCCPILRSETLLSSVQARQAKNRFQKLFQQNHKFAQVIQRGAEQFCARQDRHGRLALPLEEAVILSCDYLLDEVVMYEVLAQEGWLVEAHIGSELEILQLFMDGAFPDISSALTNRKYIELKTRHSKQGKKHDHSSNNNGTGGLSSALHRVGMA